MDRLFEVVFYFLVRLFIPAMACAADLVSKGSYLFLYKPSLIAWYEKGRFVVCFVCLIFKAEGV